MRRFTWFNATSLTLGFAFLYLPMVLLAEAFAVTVEALWLHRHQVKHPWRWSLAAKMPHALY